VAALVRSPGGGLSAPCAAVMNGYGALVMQLQCKFRLDAESGSGTEAKEAIRWLERIEDAEEGEIKERDQRAQERLMAEMQIQDAQMQARDAERKTAEEMHKVKADAAADKSFVTKLFEDIEKLKQVISQREKVIKEKDAEIQAKNDELERQQSELKERAWYVQQLMTMGGGGGNATADAVRKSTGLANKGKMESAEDEEEQRGQQRDTKASEEAAAAVAGEGRASPGMTRRERRTGGTALDVAREAADGGPRDTPAASAVRADH